MNNQSKTSSMLIVFKAKISRYKNTNISERELCYYVDLLLKIYIRYKRIDFVCSNAY